jgi:hypothetical protein
MRRRSGVALDAGSPLVRCHNRMSDDRAAKPVLGGACHTSCAADFHTLVTISPLTERPEGSLRRGGCLATQNGPIARGHRHDSTTQVR